MNITFGKYDHIIRARVIFHRDRFSAYIQAKGLTDQEGKEHLVVFAKAYGIERVAAEVDQYVPEDLHSSRMPEIGKEEIS